MEGRMRGKRDGEKRRGLRTVRCEVPMHFCGQVRDVADYPARAGGGEGGIDFGDGNSEDGAEE